MYTYSVDGRILVLRPSGSPTDDQRVHLYATIAGDPNVPDGANVIIDTTTLDAPMSAEDTERRARLLVAQLGHKLGRNCAVIVSPQMALAAQQFQSMGQQLGVRVAMFGSEAEAREWIRKFE